MRLWAAKDSLNNPTNDPMFSKFVGKAVGSVDGFSLPEGDVADYYKYSDIKINWIVKSPANDVSKITAPIVFEYVPYPETETSAKPVEVVGNSTIDNQPMKGKKLTYYVFPAYYTDTPAEDEITARQIIEDILADSISTSMFDKATLELKNGDVTFETLIKGDSASEDKSMKNSLADIYYYMDYPSYATKETTDETTTQVITRFEGYLKSRLDKIAAIEGIDAKVRADFKTYSEDTLKNTYDETIIKNVTHAIFDIIEDLEMKKDANGKVILPEEAVEEMYEILYENAEATFYTGTTTQDGSTVSLYSVYGTFRNYLIETKTETGATTELTFEQACEKIRDEARAFVERSVKIHFAANAFGLLLTDDEYKEMTYDDGNYNYYVTSYGDIGFRLVYQFDKLFTELLYVDGEKQSLEDYEAELENNPDAEYDFEITYVDGKIKFDNVKYELATED